MGVYGIDLGTTNSVIAKWDNDNAKVLKNEHGQTTMPSCVGFTNSGVLIGNSASKQRIENPENTIYESKRAIGRSAESVEDEFKYMPFKMTNESQPKFSVKVGDANKLISPEEIAAIILKELNGIADTQSPTQSQDEVKEVK